MSCVADGFSSDACPGPGRISATFGNQALTYDRAASLKAPDEPNAPPRNFSEADTSRDLWCSLTILYCIIEVTRISGETADAKALKQNVRPWLPKILELCTQVIAQMRWDEAAPIPSSKLFLLYWKTMLLSFGGLKDVARVKASFRDEQEEKDSRGHPVITASPLDYHLFRQEISSKYPAYQAPQPLFPFEPENNTILPPLQHRQAKLDATDTASANPTGDSIMHRPVHIATPAPSPPPSPAGPGGKGGKKQNYQTNQMFPLLYPPLDASSNDLGGKGSTELQDALVGRKWQGSDIPASILEAAELFAKRMRATRAMKQLWEARVDFMKYERGYRDEDHDGDGDVDELDLDSPTSEKPEKDASEAGPSPTDAEVRLAAVDAYYRQCLPHMQSVVIVLLKGVLKHVTDLVAQTNNRNGLQPGFQEGGNGAAQGQSAENGDGHAADLNSITAEQVDIARTHEITCKALTAVLLLLLKWFKVSRA